MPTKPSIAAITEEGGPGESKEDGGLTFVDGADRHADGGAHDDGKEQEPNGSQDDGPAG